MVSSKRGAAQIGLIWIIAFGVIALAAIAFGYIAQDSGARATEDAAAAEEELNRRALDVAVHRDLLREISASVGGYAETGGGGAVNLDPLYDAMDATQLETLRNQLAGGFNVGITSSTAISGALDTFRQTFTDVPSAEGTTLVDALAPASEMYKAAVQQLADKNAEIQRLQAEVQTVREQRRTDVAAKDEEISRLSNQLSDARSNADDRESELNAAVARAESEANDLDLQTRQLEQQMEELVRDYDQRIAGLTSRLVEQGEKLAPLTAQGRELADARIINVSPELGLGFIDIGANNRLSRGIRFRITAPGSGETKAIAEVTDVQPNMAEVAIMDVSDTFDPVVPGDELINELYDPSGERTAVLIGRFDGAYGEGTLRALLDRIGIRVQDQLALTTDFAIVGSELYVDEFGEPYEEPIDPSELPVYSAAVDQGVKVIPLQQVREFFVFE